MLGVLCLYSGSQVYGKLINLENYEHMQWGQNV